MLFLASLAAPVTARAVDDAGCLRGVGSTIRTLGRGFVARIEPAPVSEGMVDENGKSFGCLATVQDVTGKSVYRKADYGIKLALVGRLGGLQSDISALFENYSGGAHCCWSYWFVSTGKKPGMFAGLENNYEIAFRKTADGLDLTANDGAFDYFDNFCHACAPGVNVFITFRGTRLINASEQHVADYDGDIARNRKSLEAGKVAQLHQLTKYAGEPELGETVAAVLNITLAYLYSGREAEAWKTLDGMWPEADVPRMKQLILDTKAKGLTSVLHDPKKMH